MRELRFTPLAADDLRSIGRYSRRHFGSRQAKLYVSLLENTCLNLASGRKIGRPAQTLYPGLRKQAVGSHVIFFHSKADVLEIVRILHGRMNARDHL